MEDFRIPTYIINLKSRTDRKKHILNEFKKHNEFDLRIMDACEHRIGAIGLWNSIIAILKNFEDSQSKNDFVLICEDDHKFTDSYSKNKLYNCINDARKGQMDILVGGVSGIGTAIQISENSFWIDLFSGTQFIIIFRKFFATLLNAPFKFDDSADFKICTLTKNKALIYPFISIQKEFGYSDVTLKNNIEGQVSKLFHESTQKLDAMAQARSFYTLDYKRDVLSLDEKSKFKNIMITTYIINRKERTDRLKHILDQFKEKPEFDLNVIEACEDKVGAIGLWKSMLKIVKMAIKNEDDIIIICEDDHEFTKDYSSNYLISNIIEAHEQGVEILSGGIGHFGYAVPLTQNRYWINPFQSTQFVILYKSIFPKMLKYKFKKTDVADLVLAGLTSHKMILYPFISRQKDFGYSDITPQHNETPGLVQHMFKRTEDRLEKIQQAYVKYLI